CPTPYQYNLPCRSRRLSDTFYRRPDTFLPRPRPTKDHRKPGSPARRYLLLQHVRGPAPEVKSGNLSLIPSAYFCSTSSENRGCLQWVCPAPDSLHCNKYVPGLFAIDW